MGVVAEMGAESGMGEMSGIGVRSGIGMEVKVRSGIGERSGVGIRWMWWRCRGRRGVWDRGEVTVWDGSGGGVRFGDSDRDEVGRLTFLGVITILLKK